MNSHDDSARGLQEGRGGIKLNHEGPGWQDGGGIPGTVCEGCLWTRGLGRLAADEAGGPRH